MEAREPLTLPTQFQLQMESQLLAHEEAMRMLELERVEMQDSHNQALRFAEARIHDQMELLYCYSGKMADLRAELAIVQGREIAATCAAAKVERSWEWRLQDE